MMLCRSPWQQGEALFPCGQCVPCRINRRRVWTHRIMLESLNHERNAFVTLTYEDENIPRTKDGLGSLRSKDVQLWLKRIRKSIEPAKVRFYVVGEYGDVTWRPHYHAALFGYPSCEFGVTRHQDQCCPQCDLVRKSWGMGHVSVGDLTIKSAAYVAGYVTKKLTREGDIKLQGRAPEFARMSLKPGIGGDALWEVASELLALGLDRKGDVPRTLRHGARELPLGRYLQRRLRVLVGKAPEAPKEVIDALSEEMRPLYEAAFAANTSLKKLHVAQTKGQADQQEYRASIWKKRATL